MMSGPLSLQPVVGKTREGKRWNEFIARYHYLGYKTLVGAQMGIVKLIECRLFSAFFHEAKLLNLRGGAIDNVPRFRSESG